MEDVAADAGTTLALVLLLLEPFILMFRCESCFLQYVPGATGLVWRR